MRKKKLLAMLLAAAAVFAGCSSDAPVPAEKNTDGTTAYLNVAIAMSQASSSRGEVDENQMYADGTADEYAVDNAIFYFYDANGNFLTEAKGISDGNSVDDANIDYQSTKTMIILTNLEEDNLPAYMVTVLNRPTGYSGTLVPMTKLLDQNIGDYKNSDGKFVMTTSSYSHDYDSNRERPPYYVTELSNDMFYRTLAAATAEDAKSVDVYVERLASKVQVSLSSSLISASNTKVIEDSDGTKRYIHRVDGVNVNGLNTLQSFYVELLGWGINGKMQTTYMFKHIDESWSNSQLGFTWNSADDHRSYWGMSYNYATQNHEYVYPSKYEDDSIGVDPDYETTELAYISATDAIRPFTGKNYDYCMENTNTVDIIKANYPNCLTSVIVLARIVDENGTPTTENWIYFMNKYYTKADYLQTAIDQMISEGKLFARNTTTTKVTIDDFDLVDCNNSEVFIVLSAAGEASLASGNQETINEINEELKKFNETSVAYSYNDGYMFYSIPIQHRNGNGATSKDDVKEATYGVVRNHLYDININSVTTLGKGINEFEEPIIVNDKDQQLYYIGAKVNILSWAKVSQNTDL